MKRKLTNKQIVEKYITDLEHFFTSDHQWPIILTSSHKELCEYVPALAIDLKQSRIYRKPKTRLNPKIEAELWKFKYNEAKSQTNKIFEALHKFIETVEY